jgi:hypothetical protein
LPNSVGSSPVRLLRDSWSRFKLVSCPKAGGVDPWSLLSVKCSSSNRYQKESWRVSACAGNY